MTSRTAEERIQFLENQQWSLERQLKDHKDDIYSLKSELQDSVKAQKKKTTPEEIKPIEPIKVDSKIPDHLGKKKLEKLTPNTPHKPKRSLRTMEQDFGKVWFVRLGIISLLTGLVFLSNFAYTNFIVEWGAGPRLAGLYFLAVVLLGLGTYFEKAKAALSNYGKVIAAGGIATLYYASYAAHYVDRLRVIDSPFIGGLLLTASAGMCLTYALWKKSNVTAICSIALAYYSTSINPVGAFSLVSGLLLTLTGLTLLHRLRSVSIGFVSMLGAYLSFIYWQLLVNDGGTDYAYTSWFIIGYWVLSTAAFLIPHKIGAHPFSKTHLLTFASLNNAFLVLLMSLDFQTSDWVDPLWPVSATIGSVFIGIAMFLQYGKKLTSDICKIPFRSSLVSLFLMKGIALITMALCLKLTGPSLALSLTIQAGILLISACRSEGPRKYLLTAASYMVIALGAYIYFSMTSQKLTTNNTYTITHFVMAVLYLGISVIAHFGVSSEDETKPAQRGFPALLSIVATSACVLFSGVPEFGAVIILLSLNIICTLYQHLSGGKNIIPDFCYGSHAFSAIGLMMFIQNLGLLVTGQYFFVTLMLFAATVINLCMFIKDGNQPKQYMAYLVAATISLLLSFGVTESMPVILVFGSLIPLAYHAFYQKFIQHDLRFIAILGFIVYPLIWFACMVSYIGYFFGPHMLVHLIVAFIPLLHILLIQQKTLAPFKSIMPIFTLATASMFAFWQITYVGPWELTLAITACVYHLLDQKENRLLTGIAAALYTSSITYATSAVETGPLVFYIIALLPLVVYFSRKFMLENTSSETSEYYISTQRGIAVIASLTLWFISSLQLLRYYNSSALSIVWAIVGLIILSLGFINRDIVFRTMAFIILGCTVLHVYGVDVWRLNAILRIVSFITLGVVLLITGYLYCRKVDQADEREG